MPRDADVDRLYQLPLAEFTAARNALAKARGADGAAVKALVKPSLPAWAVNQIHWRQPEVFGRLVRAAEAVRAAHARVLSGAGGDVAAAEAAHRDALKAASAAARAELAAAGEAATPATLSAITETLQALPSEAAPGRLIKPLKPRGFEALTGLVPRLPSALAAVAAPAPASRAGQTTDPRAAAADARRAAAAARRAERARRRERASVEKALTSAKRAEKRVAADRRDAERLLDRAERAHQQLRDQLQFALKQIQDHRDDIARLEQRRRETQGERERLEARLDALKAAR